MIYMPECVKKRQMTFYYHVVARPTSDYAWLILADLGIIGGLLERHYGFKPTHSLAAASVLHRIMRTQLPKF